MKIIDSVLLGGLVLGIAGCDAILGIGETRVSNSTRSGMDASMANDGGRNRPPDTGMDASSAGEAGNVSLHDSSTGDSADRNTSVSQSMDATVDSGRDAGQADVGPKDTGFPDAHFDGGTTDADGSVTCEEDDASCPDRTLKPSALHGLVLWLDAARGVTTTGLGANALVNAWKDLSGYRNDALQPDAEKQPTLLKGAANGLPAIRFDGINGRLNVLVVADAASLNCGTGDFVVEIVAEWSNPTTPSTQSGWSIGYGTLLSKQLPDPPYPGIGLWANYPPNQAEPQSRLGFTVSGYLVATKTSGLNDSRFRLYGGRRAGGSGVELRINGSVDERYVIPVSSSVDSPAHLLEIGGVTGNGASQALDGMISEIAIICGPVRDADLAKLDAYFNDKYQLWL